MKKGLLIILIALIFLGCLADYQYARYNDGKLRIIFCDVGQGDAILIKTPTGKHILVDGGPDRKVLDCLSQFMPFWERKIDLVILTHPHADHFMGMFYVLDRYHITSFATEKLANKSDDFHELMKEIQNRAVPITYVSAGDRWRLQLENLPLSIYHLPFISKLGKENGKSMEDGTWKMENEIVISIKSPTEAFLQRTSPNGEIGESKEFASLITHVSYGSFDVLLTGDSQVNALSEAVDFMNGRLDVLQAPHHGSATGLTRAFLQKKHPELTIISVGEKNRYGHPSKNTLQSLKEQGIPFLRTDEKGNVEVMSDGKRFEVRGER